MNKYLLIVLTLAVIAAISLGGYIVGFKLNETPSPVAALDAEQQAQENTTLYNVSSPSSGPLPVFYPLTLNYEGSAVTATLPAGIIDNPTFMPPVRVYQQDGLPYLQEAQITSMSSAADNPDLTLLTIELPENILQDKPTRAALLRFRNPGAKRLPVSALITTQTGDQYFWAANLDETRPERATAEKIPVQNPVMNAHFFDAGSAFRVTRLAILNPDSALKDGQRINIRHHKFDISAADERSEAVYQKANEGKSCAPRSSDGAMECSANPYFSEPQQDGE